MAERIPLPTNSINPDSKNIIDACNNGFYVYEGKHIDIKDLIEKCLECTMSYPPDYEYDTSKAQVGEGNITVVKKSTTNSIYDLYKEGKKNICALNFANPFIPGGGWLNFANAQEETLCRSSALAYSILQMKDFYQYNTEKGSNISSDYMIYSPSCPFWKIDNYTILPEPYIADVITSAAVAHFMLSPNEEETAYDIMEIRIRKIIMCCVEKGARNLVLGAFGCGVFRNDPKIIASLFYKILIDEKYARMFETITFAITGYNSVNLNAFLEKFDASLKEH